MNRIVLFLLLCLTLALAGCGGGGKKTKQAKHYDPTAVDWSDADGSRTTYLREA